MTDVIQLLSFLDNILGTHSPQHRSEYVWSCPFCSHHKPKLAVNLSSGQWHCWVCQTKGRSLFSLLKRMDVPKTRISELAKLLNQEWKFTKPEKTTEISLTLPSEYRPLWKVGSRDLEGRYALAYLNRRGITMVEVMKYQLGYCVTGEYFGRIIIPSYDAGGKLNFFVGRSYDLESTFPYKNPPVSKNIVGFESLISWAFELFICEGPLDAMTIKRNAVPLFGKTMSPRLRDAIILNRPPAVYFALDSDALHSSANMAEDIRKQDINTFVVKLNGKDPSDIGFQQFWIAVDQAKEFTFSELVRLKL